MWRVYITEPGICMVWGIKAPASVSLTFHWYIMENQTPLSVHQAIKDKCVCYCSHSVFLSVLWGPLGDVKACCRTTINPKLIVLLFFLTQREAVVWPKIDHGSGLDRDLWQAPLRTEWTAVFDTWPVSILNHKAAPPSETPTKACVVVLGRSKALNIPLVSHSDLVWYISTAPVLWIGSARRVQLENFLFVVSLCTCMANSRRSQYEIHTKIYIHIDIVAVQNYLVKCPKPMMKWSRNNVYSQSL